MPENSWRESDSCNDLPNQPSNNSRPFDPSGSPNSIDSSLDGSLIDKSHIDKSHIDKSLIDKFPIDKFPIDNSLIDDSFNAPVNELVDRFAIDGFADEMLDPFQRGMAGRRRKAALALTAIWGSTIALHLSTWGSWFVLCLTTLMGLHLLRVLLVRPIAVPEPIHSDRPEDYPKISLLVSAKNEESVIGALVENLCTLDYPPDRYEVWMIDDASSDRTPLVLQKLSEQYAQLNVVRRAANATGGKSGALNQILPLTQGDLIAVFDADAQVPDDLLRRVVPLFQREKVGAVQVRKAVANEPVNFWTRGQAAEMAVDSFFQQQRIAIGGIGELRGNGQFVRRTALEDCGGWNEETITDDLDLTLRLHLNHWDIDFLLTPAVGEEGVTRAIGLWHQRNRWAEGGYQRYLDYWRLIGRNRLGVNKSIDLLTFLMFQYVMPTATVPDLLMAIVRNTPPILAPITSVTVTFSMLGMWIGLRRIRRHSGSFKFRSGNPEPLSNFRLLTRTALGTLYMLHWLPIVASVTARIAVRQKRLKWVKTVHHGVEVESLEV